MNPRDDGQSFEMIFDPFRKMFLSSTPYKIDLMNVLTIGMQQQYYIKNDIRKCSRKPTHLADPFDWKVCFYYLLFRS